MASTQERQARQQRIVAALQRSGAATVVELATELDVAAMTIRRDLETLERDGALRRFHGGAELVHRSGYEPPIAVRTHTNAAAKAAIGVAVAARIVDGETVVIDGGSTGLAIAEALVDRSITVCPLSLRVAWVFERARSVRIVLPAGHVRPGELSISGPETIDYLQTHHFDRYVLTASGLSLEDGLTEWNADDAGVKRAALRAASIITAAVDASKVGQTAFASIAPIDAVDEVVVDAGIAADAAAALRSRVRLILA